MSSSYQPTKKQMAAHLRDYLRNKHSAIDMTTAVVTKSINADEAGDPYFDVVVPGWGTTYQIKITKREGSR